MPESVLSILVNLCNILQHSFLDCHVDCKQSCEWVEMLEHFNVEILEKLSLQKSRILIRDSWEIYRSKSWEFWIEILEKFIVAKVENSESRFLRNLSLQKLRILKVFLPL